MTTKIKICKNCKWYCLSELSKETEIGEKENFDKCTKFNSQHISLITGKCVKKTATIVSDYCEILRKDNWFLCRLVGSCGNEGRFYEKKVKK